MQIHHLGVEEADKGGLVPAEVSCPEMHQSR